MKHNQFTDAAAHAMRLAGGAAQFFHMNRIGTEHLLAGLLQAEDGTAHVLLTEAGVKHTSLLTLIERLVAPTSLRKLPPEKAPEERSARCEEAVRTAVVLAEQFGQEKIGTEHLLMALLHAAAPEIKRRGHRRKYHKDDDDRYPVLQLMLLPLHSSQKTRINSSRP